MNSQKSIYEYILEHLKDEQLERSFSLPELEEEDEDAPRFADGAMDGISLYHMGPARLDAAGTRMMLRALKYACAGMKQDADKAFAALGSSFRAISIADELQSYILDHTDRFPAAEIYETAGYLMLHSADRESVKFGLCLAGLFELGEDPLKEVIRRLGYSDEFTIFAVWNMLKWENANQEVFGLIQKVYGWGRIHALEMLEPETPEIREWILLNGVDNDVLAAYSARAAWEKAGVEQRLKGPLTLEEYQAAGRIFQALLDEGPVPGISETDHAADCIRLYLSRAEAFGPEAVDGELTGQLKQWLAERES